MAGYLPAHLLGTYVWSSRNAMDVHALGRLRHAGLWVHFNSFYGIYASPAVNMV
jgi:hypothetical protein